MKKKQIRKWILATAFILGSFVIGPLLYGFVNGKPGNDDVVIIKENVFTISDETEKEKQPVEVTENEVVFQWNPQYQKGDVIVSGITDSSPEGFLRKVVGTEKEGNVYRVRTEPAVLTDVFEKAHIAKTLKITETGVQEARPDERDSGVRHSGVEDSRLSDPAAPDSGFMNLNMVSDGTKNILSAEKSPSFDPSVITLSDTETKKSSLKKKTGVKFLEDDDYLLGIEFEKELEEGITASGETGVSIWVEVVLDIQDGNVECGILARQKSKLELQLGYEKEFKKKEFEKTIYPQKLPSFKLPAFEFPVGPVMIVITNEFMVDFQGKVEIEGSIGLSYENKWESAYGFLYSGKNGKVKKIKEHKSSSDGLEWSSPKISGKCSGGLFFHLTTKLYGSTGMDLAAGISGEAEGEVKLGASKEFDGLVGSLDLSISPKVQATVVVSVPVIDKRLIAQPLLRLKMKPIWEKHWQSSKNWKADLAKAFEGEENKDGENEEDSSGYGEGDDKKGSYIYKTRYGEINGIAWPQFQFLCPPRWEITEEDVGSDTDADYIVNEEVVLTNPRGVTVTYWDFQEAPGDYSRIMTRAIAQKAADSSFQPSIPAGTNKDYSGLGKFIVAKVKVTGELNMNHEADFTPFDGGVFYAVVPEFYVGEHEYQGLSGELDEFSFSYPTPYAIIAKAPEGEFVGNEEKEVIEILKSFRVAD